jgi:CO/xanthine dehydrogenase FAD-binding subunit
LAERVAEASVAGAQPREHNAYKILLAKSLVKRALMELAADRG